MADLRESIVVVLQTKGGAGKSTTALQVVTPYLYFMMNGNKVDEKNIKVKLFDIDAKNSSSEILSESKLFNSTLIQRCDRELEKVLSEEINSLKRDYPIVFDVGNTYTKEFLDVLGTIYLSGNKVINFIVPVKQDDDDVRNARDTIKLIKKSGANANIIIACSDSISNPDDFRDVKLEFEMLFGGYYDFNNKKVGTSLFEDMKIDNGKYIVIKKTIEGGNLLVRSKIWSRKSMWECNLEALDIRKNHNKNELVASYEDLRQKARKLYQEKKETEAVKIEAEAIIINELINIFNYCEKYSSNYLEITFEQLGKVLV